jgi:uncharacterized protein YlbG (UPF0298 family)
MNSHFYCTDENIEKLLEALNEWKIKAVEQNAKDTLQDKIKKAQEELDKLKILEGIKE